MRWLLPVVFGATLLTPFAVDAAEFSSKALFLSRSSVTEGETVLMYAVVTNATSAAFSGEVRYISGDATLGIVPVALSAGEARTVSISWTPSAGSHIVVAELRSSEGIVAASERATFVVTQKPVASSEEEVASPSTIESSEALQKVIANVSQPVAERSEPVFATIDSIRAQGAQFLYGQIEHAKERLAEQAVLGAATETPSAKGSQTFWKVFQTLYLYLLTILRQVLATAAFFYPILAGLFLYSLWRLYRRMSTR